ncbi:hypothetical protein PsYK624_104700 [Phanerochaete sordida]|uniref:WD40 repeat-like protein n=1 Tax=Phanerochaete sordida TaxID=48140 RepID=A0A9P3LG82_9APHY|nr:hypothetical protein PsYK624_104700 [Phanerochaete sordida]
MFTIHQTLDSRAPYRIYEASLSELGSGCPLWYPEPHVTGEPQIGDVGYVRDGAFVRLFNLNSTADYSVKHWRTAYKVEPSLPEDVFALDKRNAPMGPGRFKSRGVEEIKLEGEATGGVESGSATLSASYACREVQGALLVLKSQAYAESLYDNEILEKYMTLEHDNWHAYARGTLGHRIDQEDIVLVSGWVKAPADWATAAFSTHNSTNQLSAKGQIGHLFGLGFLRSRHKSYSGPEMERSGAKYPKKAGSDALKDQCVFVKRYKIKKRLGIVRIMVAGAGSHAFPPEDDGSGADGPTALSSDQNLGVPVALFNEEKGRFIEPLDVLLEYILEVSEARYAIARDEDIDSVLGGATHPADFSTYLRQRQPPVVVDDNRGRIATLDLMQHDQSKLRRPRISRPDIERWPHISMNGSAVVQFARVSLPQKKKQTSRELATFPYLLFNETTGITRNPHRYALSTDGALIAVVGQTPEITIWRTSDGLRLSRLGEDGQRSSITAITFSPDGRRLVSAPWSQELIVWDVVHGAPLSRLPRHSSHAAFLSFSPCGRYLACGSTNGHIEIWNSPSGPSAYTSSLGSEILGLVYDPEGRQLAVVLRGKVVIHLVGSRISELTTIRLPHTEKSYTATFSPNGDRILICVEGQSARVYTTKKGKEALRSDTRGRSVVAAALSPDGATLASASVDPDRGADAIIVLQESSKGTELRRIPILVGGSSLSFSPDGAFIVAVWDLGSVTVHNAKSGTQVARLAGVSQQPLTDVRFLPDSRRILFAYAGGPLGIISIADTLRVH